MLGCSSKDHDFAVNIFKSMESVSEAFDNAFGKLPVFVQVALVTVFSILCDA
jgi:hypothetical protein